MYLFALTNLNCFDWSKVTPPPCGVSSPDWGIIKTFKICADTLPNWNCDTNCCFTFTYFERWNPPGQSPSIYEISLTGIFYSPDSLCSQCSIDTLISIFTSKLMSVKSQEPDFSRTLTDSTFPISESVTINISLYTHAKCLRQNNDSCSSTCCIHINSVIIDTNGYINPDSVFEASSNQLPPTCDTVNGCYVSCKKVLFEPFPDTLSYKCGEYECSSGLWGDIKSKTIKYPYCDCEFTFRYRERTTHCVPKFKDYMLLDSIDITNCDSICPGIQIQEYISAANFWLLKYGGLELPTPCSCDSTFRSITAQCWKRTNISDTVRLEFCLDSGCCISKYTICVDTCFTRDTTIIIDTTISPINVRCDSNCSMFCYNYPVKKIVFNDNLYNFDEKEQKYFSIYDITPQPVKNELFISIILNFKADLTILIFNLFGELIDTHNINAFNGLNRSIINCNNKPSGIYYCQFYIDNNYITTKKFLIVR